MLLTVLRNALCGKPIHLLEDSVQKSRVNFTAGFKKSTRMPNTSTDATQPDKQSANNSKPTLRQEKHKKYNKIGSTSLIPSTVTLQILGTGSNGSPASVYLFTDHSRYLFNCGEGTQRLAHEHKTKLSRLEQIFVTRNTWPAIGGFPGLALTVQDAGVKLLALHGPPFLENILYSMKRFVVLKNLQLKTVDCTEIQDFEDSVMTVKSVPLFRKFEHIKQDEKYVFNDSSEEQIAITYICKLKPKLGALNLEKCVDYGVPPGPLLGLLKNGIDVTLDNGTVVKSKDVSEPNENPLTFMFLDIPALEFLGNLEKHEEILVNSRINSDNTPELPLVVHFSPQEVINNDLYKAFVEKFPAATRHIYLNCNQNSFSGYTAAHRIQYQLNLLNPKVFPLLKEDTNFCNQLKKTKLDDDHVNGKLETDLADSRSNLQDNRFITDLNSMSFYHLRPRKGLDRSSEAKLAPSEYIQETQDLPDFPALLAKFRDDLKQKTCSTHSSIEYPVITFLGTGSCIPNKTRNVSSILIQQQEDSFVLLDCGEGTLGQIQRFFGCKKAEDVVKNLKCIYISHLHADHHIGLIALLTERLKLLGNKEDIKKILLLAPIQIEPWLNFYHERIFNIKNSYELISNATMLGEPLNLKNYTDFGIESIRTCLVKHCPHSFGVSLEITEKNKQNKPIKITYSGDTMPCQDLIDLGLNSDVLIHEATMEDDLIKEAKIKTHSTISQAIKQGQLMNAQHTILTHFSQRYAKLPRLQSNTTCSLTNSSTTSLDDSKEKSLINENVSIAFDNMQVSLTDLELFHLMYPAMQSLFAEHAEELEQRALKREYKLERKRKMSS